MVESVVIEPGISKVLSMNNDEFEIVIRCKSFNCVIMSCMSVSVKNLCTMY